MSDKQLLRLMEGKKHDRRKPYSRAVDRELEFRDRMAFLRQEWIDGGATIRISDEFDNVVADIPASPDGRARRRAKKIATFIIERCGAKA